jgi:hypothetical protein
MHIICLDTGQKADLEINFQKLHFFYFFTRQIQSHKRVLEATYYKTGISLGKCCN